MPFFLKLWEASQTYVGKNHVTGQTAWSFFEPVQLIVLSRLPHNLGNSSLFCLVGLILGALFIIKQRKDKPVRFLFLLFGIIEPVVSVYLFYFVVDTAVQKPKSNYFLQSIIPLIIISSYGYLASLRILTAKISFKSKE